MSWVELSWVELSWVELNLSHVTFPPSWCMSCNFNREFVCVCIMYIEWIRTKNKNEEEPKQRKNILILVNMLGSDGPGLKQVWLSLLHNLLHNTNDAPYLMHETKCSFSGSTITLIWARICQQQLLHCISYYISFHWISSFLSQLEIIIIKIIITSINIKMVIQLILIFDQTNLNELNEFSVDSKFLYIA